ncbi:MAG: SCP2 sterol-binding domain-containing protein [Spirochaetes bacterium]|nr:SCP2 sterol-binding domain-containing protein [Spirochaetota bacterium]NMB65442.1 SCP2 sterol-binding domain-containing protein [Spirochaetota bacterium]
MPQELMYLTKEWRDEAERRLKNELTPEKMNFITSSMSNIYLNCPDGKNKYLFFKFVDGKLDTLALGEGEPPDAEFRISGDYQVFAMISRAELGSQKALMTGKLKLKGNMVKALKLAAIADRLNKVLSQIPAQY